MPISARTIPRYLTGVDSASTENEIGTMKPMQPPNIDLLEREREKHNIVYSKCYE